MRAHQPLQRRGGAKPGDIATSPRDVGFEVGGDQPRMGFDAIEDARQQRLLHAAIAQPSDRGDRDRNQQDHRDGQSGGKRHLYFRVASVPFWHEAGQDGRRRLGIMGRAQCSPLEPMMTMSASRRQDNPRRPRAKRSV